MGGTRKDVAVLNGEKIADKPRKKASQSQNVVQSGAFTLKKCAEYKLNALKSAGYSNAFVELESGWWKVRIGPYTKRNAENLVAKLQKDGFTAIIVKVK